MPTQSEFEWAAREFERAATQLDALVALPARVLGSSVMVGGRLTDDLHALFAHAGAALRRHGDELHGLATTCRARASACADYRLQRSSYNDARDRYDAEVRRWHALTVAHEDDPVAYASPGPAPIAPVAPDDPPAWLIPDAA